MSRVESKIKVGSRVIYSETTSYTNGTITMIFSGRVFTLSTRDSAHITDIQLHSLEFSSGRDGTISLHIEKNAIKNISDLKSIDDLRYKK